MKITGIIAECNPFHEGHAYLLQKAKELTNADYIVVAISGDYVQRGAPAILGWEQRTRALLEHGADLVVQLPLYTSCTGADYFARGSISLLDSLGVVTDICFGSECGNLGELLKAADALTHVTDVQNQTIRALLKEGHTYAAARARALSGESVTMPDTANDLLAVEYLRALHARNLSMIPHAILRTKCASASSLRAEILDVVRGEAWDVAERIFTELPAVTKEQFVSVEGFQAALSTDDFSGALLHSLLYRPTLSKSADLAAYLDVSGDLANRIKANLSSFESFDSFCSLLKNRSVTYTRVARALMHILLEMTDEKMALFEAARMCHYIRPLGFRKTAGPLLKEITTHATVPFLSKLSKASEQLDPVALRFLEEDLRAEHLYDLSVQDKILRNKNGHRHGQASPVNQGLTVSPVRHPYEKKQIII